MLSLLPHLNIQTQRWPGPWDAIVFFTGNLNQGLPRLTNNPCQGDDSSIVTIDFWCSWCGHSRTGWPSNTPVLSGQDIINVGLLKQSNTFKLLCLVLTTESSPTPGGIVVPTTCIPTQVFTWIRNKFVRFCHHIRFDVPIALDQVCVSQQNQQ